MPWSGRVVISGIGRRMLAAFAELGEVTLFLGTIFKRMFSRPFFFQETVNQVYLIGVQSFALTGVTAFAVGIVLAMQTVGVLSRFGAQNYVALVVSMSVLRELGPVLTAIMVAGRAGSGIAAEIGSMKVTRQVDALQVSVVNPIKYLVVTRTLACTLVVPMLALLADVLGLVGGMLAAGASGVSPHLYYIIMMRYVRFVDVLPGLLKAAIFGLMVGLIACFKGFRTTGGTAGVGRATTTTVVTASLTIMISDVFLTKVMMIIFE